LITGITGQDGPLLAEFLLARGYDIIGFGRRSSIIIRPDLKELLGRITIAYGDLTDGVSIASAIQDHQPDEVYNLASQSTPGVSWERAVETAEVTGLGALHLFEAVRRFRSGCRIYQASSSEMFGDVLESPQTETTPFNPTNPYGAAKVYAHLMAKIYRKSYGMFVACGILFNHESPARGLRFLTQKVALGAACASLGIQTSAELNEYGDPIVSGGLLSLGNLNAQRDWGAAGDYVDAMWRMLQHESPEDFVIGTGELRTVSDLCESAYSSVGLDWRRHVVSDPRLMRLSETGATVANAAKAKQLLGWAPTISFDTMMRDMVEARVSLVRARISRGIG